MNPQARIALSFPVISVHFQHIFISQIWPRWGASEHSWSFGLPGLRVDAQCTSKLLEAASRKLNAQRRLCGLECGNDGTAGGVYLY